MVLKNESLQITVLPEVGGNIRSIRELGSGREWLWHNPHLAVKPPVYGASYVETMDSGGWDEICPSVTPDLVDGRVIPDHGDLVGLPWNVLDCHDTRLALEVRTRFADCVFKREIMLDGNCLMIHYTLHNHEAVAVPYLWCAHPLLAIEKGMRIELPHGTRMQVMGGVAVLEGVSEFRWPHVPGLPPLDVIPDVDDADFQRFALKIFTADQVVDCVKVITADGDGKLEISWDHQKIPHLGLWLNMGAWSGCGSSPYCNLGVEPTTACADALSAAMAGGSDHWLAAGESVSWSLRVQIGD